MGSSLATLWTRLTTGKTFRVLMVGLDGAGKTSIFTHMRFGGDIPKVPTISFAVENIQYKRMTFLVWQLGGQDRLRGFLRTLCKDTHGVVLVVDSGDRERIALVRQELMSLLAEEGLEGAAVLILANKHDLPGAMQISEVAEQLQLPESMHGREWYVQATCATSGEGIAEGVDWLYDALMAKSR